MSCRKSLLLRTQRTTETNKKWCLSPTHCILICFVCALRLWGSCTMTTVDDARYQTIFLFMASKTHTRTWNDRRSVFGARNCKRTPCSRWPNRFTHNECVRAEENVHRMSLNLYQQIYVKWANRIEVVNHWRNMDPLIAIAFCPFCIFISINVSSQAATASAAMALHHFRAVEYILHSFRDIEKNIGRILCITMAYVSKGKAYNNS